MIASCLLLGGEMAAPQALACLHDGHAFLGHVLLHMVLCFCRHVKQNLVDIPILRVLFTLFVDIATDQPLRMQRSRRRHMAVILHPIDRRIR